MRIQPHVWAAAALERPESYLVDVVRNAVCTHSHPIGILGAVLPLVGSGEGFGLRLLPEPE